MMLGWSPELIQRLAAQADNKVLCLFIHCHCNSCYNGCFNKLTKQIATGWGSEDKEKPYAQGVLCGVQSPIKPVDNQPIHYVVLVIRKRQCMLTCNLIGLKWYHHDGCYEFVHFYPFTHGVNWNEVEGVGGAKENLLSFMGVTIKAYKFLHVVPSVKHVEGYS